MTREVLPNRRSAEIFEFQHSGLALTVTVGRYRAGRVGEIFISTTKAGSDVAHLARDAAILSSLALQHGATIEELATAVTRQPDGAPAHLAGAVLDEIIRRQESGSGSDHLPEPIAFSPPPEPEMRTIGFLGGMPRMSGDLCRDCGAAAMVRTGTCLTCQNCAGTSGGCS